MAKIIIPTPLRKFTENMAHYDAPGATVGDSISNLVATFPDLGKQLLDSNGVIRSFVNIFVGDENIRSLEKEATPLAEGSIISIVPAIAGGSR
ncbi:MAG TPA: molybdopterin synthase sulfur carrier subunit [Bacteroidetes bacterium]|nr:molybdopterin synthase sulfur carrier subunit [Bacteroidota bacterium]